MKKYRVFATCDIGAEALHRLVEQGYELELYDRVDPPPKSLILKKVKSGVDALITTLRDEIDEEVFQAGKNTLKVIAQDAVGFDNIDREAANRYQIPFTNTTEVLTEATAEFAFFILGCVSRKLYPSERLVREKKWKTWHPYLPLLGDEATGKTVAVIGTGRIGKAFILKCTGMDMDILCHDALAEDHEFIASLQELFDLKFKSRLSKRRRTIRYVSFKEALQKGDYVTLHVPLAPETHHLIDDSALDLMKPTAYLINTSRGPIVDEQALYRALKENQIAGVALDVFEQEPLSEDSPLRDEQLQERVRLFHHFASAGRQTRLSPDPEVGMAGRCVQGVIDVLAGHYGGDPSRMPYVVNKEAFKSLVSDQ
ncbi:D-glycerate dehydrogenase [Acidobacteria bacterium AH-259-A15]|nr:D-glycerate dehydrogenase [Acidobacteria bacterium AH-259-A15]